MSKTQKYEVEKELAVVKKMGGESIFDILRTSFFFCPGHNDCRGMIKLKMASWVVG